MVNEVHPADRPRDPSRELLCVASRVTKPWLKRLVTDRAASAGIDITEADSSIDRMADLGAARLLSELEILLATDVDEQSTNPLSLFRNAIVGPTSVLVELGVPSLGADGFVHEMFPDDVYELGPATWAEVDAELHDPGIAWGAWKAMTILRRRREESLR